MGQGNIGDITKALTANRKEPIAAKGNSSVMPLDDIGPRPHAQTRPADPTHVAALRDSIAAVGLISPIAVDTNGVLLAGLHRLDAIKALQATDRKRFGELFGAGVPVRRFDFDAVADPSQALIVEASENEQRRDYTPEEVRQLADRLVAAGYIQREGRPAKGEKALRPALALIIGKSEKTIQRYLQPPKLETKTDVQVAVWAKRRSTLRKWRDDSIALENGPELVEAIDRLLDQLMGAEMPPPPR
jgi:ParB family transcriptional regulator, chromosome partitioning protein